MSEFILPLGEKLVFLQQVAERTVSWAIRRLCPERTGGHFCVVAASCGEVLLLTRIGVIHNNSKAARYFELCQEKALRLSQRPTDVTSWQSRNEDAGMYGGAIRCGDLILSFSGFPELVDEAVMLVTAIITESLSEDEARRMAEISSNPHLDNLLNVIPEELSS